MKVFKLILIAIVLVLFAGCTEQVDSTLIEHIATAYSEKTLEMEKAPQIKILGDNCKFEFYSWTKESVKFETEFKVKGKEELETLEEYAKKEKPELRQDGRVITCQARFKSPKSNISCSSEIRVFLPKEVKAIQFDINDGSLVFQDDLSCQMSGEGKKVSLSLSSFKGRVNFNTSQGNVLISGGRIEGGSTIYTGKGNIDVKALFEGQDDSSLETALGNIHLELPDKSKVAVQTTGKVEQNDAEGWDYPAKIRLISKLGRIWVAKYN